MGPEHLQRCKIRQRPWCHPRPYGSRNARRKANPAQAHLEAAVPAWQRTLPPAHVDKGTGLLLAQCHQKLVHQL